MLNYRSKRFKIIYKIVPVEIDIVAIGPRRYIYEETSLVISRENPE